MFRKSRPAQAQQGSIPHPVLNGGRGYPTKSLNPKPLNPKPYFSNRTNILYLGSNILTRLEARIGWIPLEVLKPGR